MSTQEKTSLHFAIVNNDIPMVKTLLQTKADVYITDKDGMTPLHYAINRTENGRKGCKIVDLLLKSGASPCLFEKCRFGFPVQMGNSGIVGGSLGDKIWNSTFHFMQVIIDGVDGYVRLKELATIVNSYVIGPEITDYILEHIVYKTVSPRLVKRMQEISEYGTYKKIFKV